jgi:hypothetical protein
MKFEFAIPTLVIDGIIVIPFLYKYPSCCVDVHKKKPPQNLSILQKLTSNISSTQTIRLLVTLIGDNVCKYLD